MQPSRGTAEAALAEVQRAFREGLRVLSTTWAAHVDAASALDKKAKEYAGILAREHARIEEEHVQIREERRRLEVDWASLESQRSRHAAPGALAAEGAREDGLAVPEETTAALEIVAPAHDLRRAAARDTGDDHKEQAVPHTVLPWSARGAGQRLAASNPLEYEVSIGGHSYAVLPPRPVGDSRPGHDMVGRVVTLPEHWEVLSTDAESFDAIIRSLASRGWGTLRLCAKDRDVRGGFSNYSTALRPFGIVGEKVHGDKIVLEEVFQEGARSFKFTDDLLSGRLVIRRAAQRW